MTRERRQDLVLIAIVVSVLLHVGLMIVIRTRVMTHVDHSKLHNQRREELRFTDYHPETDPVRLEKLKDILAVKEAPVAETEETILPSKETPPEAQRPTAADAPRPDFADEEKSAIDAPETFEEKALDAEKEVASTVEAMPTYVPEVSRTLTAPDGADRLNLVHAENWGSPEVEFEVPSIGADDRKMTFGEDSVARPKFTPSNSVFKSVDEKIIEEEKRAVRNLLLDNAKELAKFVNVTMVKSSDKDWNYFRVMISPRSTLPIVPKDAVILIDASGSIGSERLISCRLAAKKILRSCMNSGDRFNIVAFRNRFAYAFDSWRECDQPTFDAADKWLAKLTAHGRTDVFGTIRSVLTLPRDPTRPLIALVVTDGDANSGVSETAEILSKFTDLNDGLISVYMYGVKSSANRELIDVLTHGNRGESFIYGGSRWSAGSEIESLSERFRDPVLSDLRVVFAADTKAEAYPKLLKNLYRGDTVELVGRMPKNVDAVSFSLKGLNGSEPYEGFFKVKFNAAGDDAGLPAAWAEEQAIDAKLR